MPKIEIVEIGDLPAGLLDAVCSRVARELGWAVVRAPARLDPVFAYDEHRAQFHAARLLDRLRQTGHRDCLAVGAASVDLFNPILTFVFGEAELPGRAAVFSMHRLREEFYGLPPNPELLVERATKELIHEVGHTLGLAHCPDHSCVMSSSHSVEAIDLKGAGMCHKCAVLSGAALEPSLRE